MKKKITLLSLLALLTVAFFSFDNSKGDTGYKNFYLKRLSNFTQQQALLRTAIEQANLTDEKDLLKIKGQLSIARMAMKNVDFWFRYLEPLAYKKINSPLPVEWETEVFEKFEKPYKREGAGLTLAELYLDEESISKDTLLSLITASMECTEVFSTDSIVHQLKDFNHFYLCNRLYLLNLATIYTTGFECPDTKQIVPELKHMLNDVDKMYAAFNLSFPSTAIPESYLTLHREAVAFVESQTNDYSSFDHFTFIKDYVNPLFQLNQEYLRLYRVFSKSMMDYSLNKQAISIFDKALYNGQNTKGIYLRVKDSAALATIDHVGKLLFFDPILSGNNNRSCASCHKPNDYFTDNSSSTNRAFNQTGTLPRNTPSLINAPYNHLVMLDGKHYSLQHQVTDVIGNMEEMGGLEAEVLKKILSCKDYKSAFKKLLVYTPQEPEITMEHITSAITLYYSKFSNAYAPFDDAINGKTVLANDVREGFNLFMSKAQCATCHFAPQFNGVKPPYVGSEFEVLGVPADTTFKKLSPDIGRYGINPAYETANAFRTGTVRNAERTAPYMHNGVFKSLNEVVDFYNNGGGAGRGIVVTNQTLSADSLNLTKVEKAKLIVFMKSLNEKISIEEPPLKLPSSSIRKLNKRVVGGTY